MDTFSGDLVNVTQAFNISENYPIFFGESESERYLRQTDSYQGGTLGAYDSDILLYTDWSEGIPNNEFRYEAEPDGNGNKGCQEGRGYEGVGLFQAYPEGF